MKPSPAAGAEGATTGEICEKRALMHTISLQTALWLKCRPLPCELSFMPSCTALVAATSAAGGAAPGPKEAGGRKCP
eukprot:scaffold4004_cov254-Prasinococcus_capsulatus_cf.AAC.1